MQIWCYTKLRNVSALVKKNTIESQPIFTITATGLDLPAQELNRITEWILSWFGKDPLNSLEIQCVIVYLSSGLRGIRDNFSFSRHLGQCAILQSSLDSKIVEIRKHD